MRYKLAIFDFDGTLSDSFPWFARVLNGVADQYGFRRVEPHEIESLRGLDAAEVIRRLGVPRWKVPLIANHMRRMKGRDRAGIPLFGGAAGMLRTLAERGPVIAIVSSDSERNVRAALGPGLAKQVAHYGCGASLFGKAAKFKAVLRRTGVAPSEAIAIGDELRDLEAARAAGIAFGAVAWGYTRPDALLARRPDEMFASVADMSARLCGPRESRK